MTGEAAKGAFDSVSTLAKRSDELIENAGQSLDSLPAAVITQFLSRAAATGAFIGGASDRHLAERIIRFWAAELIGRGAGGTKWSAPKLAAQDDRRDIAKSASPSPEADEAELKRSRALVRISAGARQWIASQDAGWLLTGDALREAERFIGADDDISALVEASRAAEVRASRWQKIGLAATAGILAGFCLILAWALQQSRTSEREAIASRDAANAEVGKANALNQSLQETRAQLAERGREQQQELDRRQGTLLEVARLVRQLRVAGQIKNDSIPQALRPLIASLDNPQAPQPDQFPALREFINGYDPAFLQTPLGAANERSGGALAIPLPKLSEALAGQAYEGGRPIDYVNFSIMLNRAWRFPVFSAANLRRSAVVAVVRARDNFHYELRVPSSYQLAPADFARNDLDRGHLVTAREIAWGPAFGADPALSGARAYALVNVMTNVTPQYDTFNRGLWAAIEHYSRETFAAQSDRVTIFSGPADNDRRPDGIEVPKRFWKVLVTTRPDDATSLVVEAYLAAQVGPDGAKIPQSTPFVPEQFRVRVSEIERLTGLDFGEIVRAADTASMPAGDLAARLNDIVAGDQAVRAARVQELLRAVRDDSLAEAVWRPLVEGIVALANIKSFETLGPEARLNVLTLLAAVPKARWDTNRWTDLKATARRAVGDAAGVLGGCANSADACALIAKLKSNLDWALATGRTAYFQFAGMVREDAKALADNLKKLGWDIPGAERTAAAAGSNKVRYTADEDRRAAELLVADLRALGRSTVRAVKERGVKPKFLEIWISI